MKSIFFIYLIFFSHMAFAADSHLMTQIPENCLQSKKFPCLVRADSQIENYDIGFNTKVTFHEKVLIKFQTHTADQTQIDLVKGNAVIKYNSKKDLEVNGIPVGSKDLYFLNREDAQIKVYKSTKSEFLSFQIMNDSTSSVDHIQVGEFPTRESVTQFISIFIKPTHKYYQVVLKDHTIRLKDESHQQQVFLQRKIAAEEEAQKLDAEARQKQNNENKKLKDLFFMRTFKQ